MTVAACALTGLRAGLHWDFPGILLFTDRLIILAVTDVCWRAPLKRIVHVTWILRSGVTCRSLRHEQCADVLGHLRPSRVRLDGKHVKSRWRRPSRHLGA
jgi:hypothetical protein